MNFELIEDKQKYKETIENLMQLYMYELSFYEDETVSFKISENGLYDPGEYFLLYFEEKIRHPFILKCNGEIAGFALYRYNEENMNEIGEFFIINKYRKLGAGTYMANKIFSMYKGKWEIRTLLKNKRAQNFWRNVIKSSNYKYYEEKLIRNNTRYGFYFEN